VKFRARGRLDTSQVSDRRGMGSGLGGIGLGRGAAYGGGGIAGVILVLVLLLANGLGNGGGGSSSSSFDGAGELGANCQTGADADQRTDCLVTGVVNSVQEYWTGAVQGTRRRRPSSSTARCRPGAGSPTRRSGRSTVRATGGCTSTSGSTTSCGRASGRRAAGSPRPTCGARVRAPRAGPARHQRPRRQRP
jgi:hypothetical protein